MSDAGLRTVTMALPGFAQSWLWLCTGFRSWNWRLFRAAETLGPHCFDYTPGALGTPRSQHGHK